MTHFYYSWCAQQTTVDFPVERTERDEFILTDGKRVYDFISTSFQANFGHRFEPICSRMVQQLKAMPIASPKSSFDLKEDVSRRLTDFQVSRGLKSGYGCAPACVASVRFSPNPPE